MFSPTRRCPRCELVKSTTEFNWRDAAHTKLQAYCRKCSNDTWRQWYKDEANRSKHLQTLKARRKRRTDRHQELVRNLKGQPCADCGEIYPAYVMDFDHLHGKKGLISDLVFQNGTNRLMEELAKCEVVCANCHRIRTQARLRSHGGCSELLCQDVNRLD